MKVHRKIWNTILLLAGCIAANAQPGTDIYLFDLVSSKDQITLSGGKNITNRKGYDNQPSFDPTKNILYYVASDSGQMTEIFVFDLRSGQRLQLTNTPEGEFSPTVVPGQKMISCISLYADGRQDLTGFSMEGKKLRALINNLTVGYHAWRTPDEVLSFVLPRPFTLHVTNTVTGRDTVIATNIGRSLHRIPGTQSVSFLVKNDSGTWDINKFDGKSVSLIVGNVNAEDGDMCWTRDGILMAFPDGIYFHLVKKNGKVLKTGWKKVQINGDFPNGKVTRLATNKAGNKLALVVSE